jgi:F0F1-type ATP synthase membrane subunit b/b'
VSADEDWQGADAPEMAEPPEGFGGETSGEEAFGADAATGVEAEPEPDSLSLVRQAADETIGSASRLLSQLDEIEQGIYSRRRAVEEEINRITTEAERYAQEMVQAADSHYREMTKAAREEADAHTARARSEAERLLSEAGRAAEAERQAAAEEASSARLAREQATAELEQSRVEAERTRAEAQGVRAHAEEYRAAQERLAEEILEQARRQSEELQANVLAELKEETTRQREEAIRDTEAIRDRVRQMLVAVHQDTERLRDSMSSLFDNRAGGPAVATTSSSLVESPGYEQGSEREGGPSAEGDWTGS